MLINNPVEMPSPTAQQMRLYAIRHKIRVEFYESHSVQMMFNHLYHAAIMQGRRGLKEMELYDDIMSEV